MLENIKNCYIIAEIGGNFKTYEEAVSLVNAAEDCGVNCVKLQTYQAKTLASKNVFFDMENTGKISQYEYFKKYELSIELQKRIFNYIDSVRLDWFSTPSHQNDVDMLISLGIKAFKIGSDDVTNTGFLKYVAKHKLPVVLSTGMCTLDEIKEAVDVILSQGNRNIALLHTVSAYPTYSEFVNLNVLNTLKKEFPGFLIGFSDHTLSPLASIAAAAMGAKIIEKHFTLDKNLEGPDHRLSATPEEMKYIVQSIREIEKMFGSGIKEPVGPERNNLIYNRKSIVMSKRIKKGEKITEACICIKKPGNGIAPKHFEEVIGKVANRDIGEDEVLNWKDIA